MLKQLKKPVSILLSLIMIVSLFTIVPFTASAASNGNFGNLSWNLDDNGVLTFSGSGAIPDYGFDWTSQPIKKIIINDSVTAIGDSAFRGCTQLKEVVFESNPVLDWDSFPWCSALESVTLPQNMETIGRGMFRGCTSLKTIELPATIKKIGMSAFNQSGLESLTVPEGVEIEEDAFEECASLQSLVLESSTPVSYQAGYLTTFGDVTTVTVSEGSHYDRKARTDYNLTLKEGAEIPEWIPAEDVAHLVESANWTFNDCIEQGMSEEEALAEASDRMPYGVELELHKTEIEAYDQIFRTGDTCPDVFGGATLKVALDDATIAAINAINAIGTVELTDACKEKVDAARAAYDALNDVQKTFVPAETLATLEAAEDAMKVSVNWIDGNGNTLKTEIVTYGETPAYTGATPYKADGADCIYTFSGWTPEVSAVTGDKTYTAQFTATAKPEVIKDCTYQFDDAKIYSNVPFMETESDLLDGAITGYIPFPGNFAVIIDTKGYSYKFYDQTGTEIPATISSKEENAGNEYGLSADDIVFKTTFSYTMPNDIKALYIVATEPAPAVDLFPQHSITLGGDIGVNFYIDSAAADFANAETAVVKFTWDNGNCHEEVDLKALTPDTSTGYYKATVDVVAAHMAHEIHAEVYLDGKKLVQTDDYSVKDYAETVYANPSAYDSEKPEQLKALAKALLNYGAMAQTVFDTALNEHPALANKTVGNNGYEGVTADQIEGAINGTASNLNEVATQLGAKYYTNSLIYLSKNTLRIYFTPTSYPGEIPNAGAYDGNLSGYYYYVDHANIPAAELDDQQTFTVGDYTFTFSALDYAKAVVESTKMEPEQQNLAKALYLYNQKANAYFDAAPAPVENVVDLGTLEGNYEAKDGDVLTGELKGDYQITIADGATVTLRNANITLTNDAEYAGITPLGDATILLEGENTVMGGYFYPGVYSAEGATLTIDGTGSLTASSNGYGAGIGSGLSGVSTTCGDITINGGTITAEGASYAAGIGSGHQSSSCGNITINGGTITANGGTEAPGIGSGTYRSSCGNITINGGTVDATGGDKSPAIGGSYGDNDKNQSKCGNITIADTVTKVTATKGSNALNTIGAGYSVPPFMTWATPCGTITIGGVVTGSITDSPYTYQP